MRAQLRSAWRTLGLGVLMAATGGSWARTADARTVYFPHQDERFLHAHQRDGGAAFVPAGAGADNPIPLVVFLHGINSTSQKHLWLGGGGRDLRPLVRGLIKSQRVGPLVLAGPSHTKNARLARKVWEGFELNAFVDDVVQATSGMVTIDRSRVVLAGHSGAGCNPNGGLAADFWSTGAPPPLALVSIDPCLDATMGDAFARRPVEVPLLLWWQSAIWAREPELFVAALERDRPQERVDRVQELPATGRNPHAAILPIALEKALRRLFGADTHH